MWQPITHWHVAIGKLDELCPQCFLLKKAINRIKIVSSLLCVASLYFQSRSVFVYLHKKGPPSDCMSHIINCHHTTHMLLTSSPLWLLHFVSLLLQGCIYLLRICTQPRVALQGPVKLILNIWTVCKRQSLISAKSECNWENFMAYFATVNKSDGVKTQTIPKQLPQASYSLTLKMYSVCKKLSYENLHDVPL